MTAISVQEFASALQKGLGRAYFRVRDHGDKGLEDHLLQACRQNLAYDPQCEPDRSRWIVDIVRHARNPHTYFDEILKIFPSTQDRADIEHQAGILALLAADAYPGARDALYDKFETDVLCESATIGEKLVQLDGISGLLHVADRAGRCLLNDQAYRENNFLLTLTSELCGVQQTRDQLTAAAHTNPNIQAYADGVMAESGYLFWQEGVSDTKPQRETYISAEAFLAKLDSLPSGGGKGLCLRFGRHATQRDIALVFARLQDSSEPASLLPCLWVFCKAELPDVPEIILEQVNAPDDRLSHAAIRALSNVRHAAVRQLALGMFDRGDARAISLLAKNFEDGDYDRISRVLCAGDDADRMHDCCVDILQVCERHSDADAGDCLTWVYEHSPCSVCRGQAVEQLIGLQSLPAVIVRECSRDCCESTRDLVAPHAG